MKELLTRTHPRWVEFVEQLAGPEGCDFHEDTEGKIRWRCSGGMDKTHATAILRTMPEIDVEATLAWYEAHGGHCDCEILWNIAGGEPEAYEEAP